MELREKILTQYPTLTAFAKAIGAPLETVSRWVQGKHKPTKVYQRLINELLVTTNAPEDDTVQSR